MTRRLTALSTAILLSLSLVIPIASVSAESGSPFSRRACTHPSVGFPTCFTQQVDGSWAQEVLADADSPWVVVGMVTFDEVAATVGDVNALAP